MSPTSYDVIDDITFQVTVRKQVSVLTCLSHTFNLPQLLLLPVTVLSSVVDPDPQGSETFCRIRIRNSRLWIRIRIRNWT
jgi:hypothetical protein